jgi:hypothetical protein
MLLYLLYPLRTYATVFNVTRYITFRTAAASLTALALSLALGPWMIRRLHDFQIGAGDPAGRATIASRQSGNTDDGRPPDSDVGHCSNAAVGGSFRLLHLDCGPGDVRVRRRWLRRRLPEACAPLAPRPDPALQDGWPDSRRDRGRRRRADAVPAEPAALQHASDLSVLQEPDPGSRLVLCRVHRARARRRQQCGEPDRWS